mmetsp:Transcript_36779/g.106008  ORF Transcript_36779/g.106008 Transcript_36779/m.106008 type:complete len:486 (-) Transcript_36779:34-1491(-)
MGGGASSRFCVEAVKHSSDAEIKSALSELTPEALQRVKGALEKSTPVAAGAPKSAEAFAIPESINEVDEKWLTKALQKAGLLEETIYVDSCQMKVLGSDEGLTSDTALVDLVYSGGEPKLAPTACAVKLPIKPGTLPQAVLSMLFQTEIDFYRHIAPGMIKQGMQAPKVYFAACSEDPATERFVLVLEHMTHPARQPPLEVGTLEDGIPMECAMLAVKQLAGFHAAFWNLGHEAFRGLENSPGVPKFHPKRISHIGDPGRKSWWATNLAKRVATTVEVFGPENTTLPADDPAVEGFRSLGAVVSKLAPAVNRRLGVFLQRLQSCPQALTHGDSHVENLFFKPGSEPAAVWFDFQALQYRAAAWDVSLMVVSSLRPEVRVSGEQALVKCYHDALLANGVESYTFEQCFSDFRFLACAPFWNVGGLILLRKGGLAEPGCFVRTKANILCQRAAAAFEAASWADFFQNGPEDSEEENPHDPERPLNFG